MTKSGLQTECCSDSEWRRALGLGGAWTFLTFVLRCSRWSAFLESGRVSPFLPKNRNFELSVTKENSYFFHFKAKPPGGQVYPHYPHVPSQSGEPCEEQQGDFDSKAVCHSFSQTCSGQRQVLVHSKPFLNWLLFPKSWGLCFHTAHHSTFSAFNRSQARAKYDSPTVISTNSYMRLIEA